MKSIYRFDWFRENAILSPYVSRHEAKRVQKRDWSLKSENFAILWCSCCRRLLLEQSETRSQPTTEDKLHWDQACDPKLMNHARFGMDFDPSSFCNELPIWFWHLTAVLHPNYHQYRTVDWSEEIEKKSTERIHGVCIFNWKLRFVSITLCMCHILIRFVSCELPITHVSLEKACVCVSALCMVLLSVFPLSFSHCVISCTACSIHRRIVSQLLQALLFIDIYIMNFSLGWQLLLKLH